ncbi:PLP-dependent aminotransferase family protein [Marinobacter sp. M1N3S26]|uniref:aminotransferase-like domain-containing protein n=1 Tax=unclassified Marinobacter TaxID=83889 RepID=UPI00387B2FD7
MDTQALYDKFRTRLDNGDWKLGQRIPSIRQVVTSEGASHHTVVKLYERLVAEGYIEAQQGRGYFVTRSGSDGSAVMMPFSSSMEMSSDPLFRLLQGHPDAVKLGCGWLPTKWRDTDILTRSIRRTARLERRSLVEYGDIQGYRPLRLQLCQHLNNKIRLHVSPMQILTTLGATQALDLVTRLLVKPGDVVLVDEPGNGNLIKLINMAGGKVIGVPRGLDGPDVAELGRLAEQHRIKAFYCNSTFHNPTGGCVSARVAFDVLRLAIEHDFMIVEDDVYGDFAAGAHQSFAELDGLERVIYIGSFSKSLSASLRIGYLACNLNLIAGLLELKLLTSVAVPGFCERFVNTIMTDGSYLKHMQSIQRKLMVQQEVTQQALRDLGWRFEIEPVGGMFLWVRHPSMDDLNPFIQRLADRNVLLMPGSSFSVNRGSDDCLRVNVSHFSPELVPLFRV